MGEVRQAGSSEGEPADSTYDDAETAPVGAPTRVEPEDGQVASVGGNLGRYVVLEEVGRGGMGRVLRAYDPKLQREVALKELRGDRLGSEGTARLIAEARAMAKLSHPNVVAVYDVEEIDGGRLVLAMEFVAGQTLRTWLRGADRDWREVVPRFIEAGRGLVAAHGAGLLHRDFKPSNVLVCDDVIKVTDFGLAKGAGQSSSSASEAGEGATGGGDLTEAGVVMGTPRYMAPEQHREGEGLTPAADQYAFCVALWEALCGEAPFAGTTMVADKGGGPPAWPNRAVPRPIVDAVRRGLCPAVAERWPSMQTLLDALHYDPARRRKRWLVALGAVTGAALVAVAWQTLGVARAERCTGAAGQLAGAWDGTRRSAVQVAMLGIGADFAGPVWERTAATLDRYATDWAAMHTDSCEATTVRGEQSPDVMDLRMACLGRARVELEAVTAELEDADAAVVRNAHKLTSGLRPLSRCADVEALQAGVEPPLPEEREVVERVRALLAEAATARTAGRYPRAREKVDAAKSESASLDYGPVHAEVALEDGAVLDDLGQFEAAEKAYRSALALASRWQQTTAMGTAAARLMHIVGYDQKRMDEGLRYRELAEGLAEDDPEQQAAVLTSLAAISKARGNYKEAEAGFRRVMELNEKIWGPDHPNVVAMQNNIGVALDDQGRFEEAVAEHRRVLAAREKTMGAEHPLVATSRGNLAASLIEQGKHAEAETELRRALALLEEALGPEHPEVVATGNNLAAVLLGQGKRDEAEAEHRRILALRKRVLGDAHLDVAGSRNGLANVLYFRGKYAQAEAQYREALAVQLGVLGPAHPDVATTRCNIALALDGQGKHEEAKAEYKVALPVLEEALGPDHPFIAQARNNLAQVAYRQGHYEESESEFRRALALRERTLGPEHPYAAESRQSIALALEGQGKVELAEAEYRLALALREKALAPDHPDVAESRRLLAHLLLTQGRPEEALELAELAWRRAERGDVPPAGRASCAAVLARALWETNASRDARLRARTLAEGAVRAYAEDEDPDEENVEELRVWLREHQAP